MSSKLSKRRATVRKPKICVAAGAPAGIHCPVPACECFFDPDEDEAWTEEQEYFDMWVYCPNVGDVYGTAALSSTGGWWTNPNHQVMNSSTLEDLEWNSGAIPGNYILTCKTTFPGDIICICTADVVVKEQEP